MLTNNEIMEWLLKNAVNDEGNLVLSDLDFSGFKGDIIINNINIKKDLFLNNIIDKDSHICGQIIKDIYSYFSDDSSTKDSYRYNQIIENINSYILNDSSTVTNNLSSIDDYNEEEEGLPFDDELSEDNYSEVY